MCDHVTTDNVSVVIPWGNSRATIDRCLNSVLAQTKLPELVVVVCNGSITRDDSENLSAQFKDRVDVFFLSGCSNANVARNVGAFSCRSRYVAFLDADDWWEVDHLATSLDELRLHPCIGVFSGYKVHMKNGKVEEKPARARNNEESMEEYLLRKNPAPTSSILVKRDVLQVESWDCGILRHQDYDFLARVSRIGEIVAKSTVTVNYEARNKSLTIPFIGDAFKVTRSWHGHVTRGVWISHFFYLFKHLPFSLSRAAIVEFLRCLPFLFKLRR